MKKILFYYSILLLMTFDSNELINIKTTCLLNPNQDTYVKYSLLKETNNYSLFTKIIIDDTITHEHISNIKYICTDLIIESNCEYSNLPINFSKISNLEILNLGSNFKCCEKLNIDLTQLVKLKKIIWSDNITIHGVREFFKYNNHLKEVIVFPSIINNCCDINKNDIMNISSSCIKFALSPCDNNPIFLNSKVFLNLKLMNNLVSFDLGNDWVYPLTDEMFMFENLEEILFGNQWCYKLDKRITKFKKLKKIVLGSLYENQIPNEIISNLHNLEEIQISDTFWIQNFEYLKSLKNINKNLKFKNYNGIELTN